MLRPRSGTAHFSTAGETGLTARLGAPGWAGETSRFDQPV